MPVSLPPPIPPAPVELRALDARAPLLGDVEYRGYRLHVHGPAALRRLPLRAIVGGARSLSDAVYRLGTSAAAAGYPAAQALYAADGHDVHVMLVLAHVTRIEGDRRLLPFFRDTLHEAPLTVPTLERDRVLAGLQADRLALAVTPVLAPDGAGGATLRLDTRKAEGVGALRIDFGNGGNRFVGRYLASVGGTVADDAGNELAVALRRGVTPLNDAGASYGEQALRLSRATPGGALGLSGQRVRFRRRLGGVDTDNALWQYGGQWLYPLHADLLRRVTVQLAIDRVERRGEVQPSGTPFFAESYTSAQLSVSGSRASYPASGGRVAVDSGLTLRKGFGESAPPLSQADLGYFAVRGLLGATARLPGAPRMRAEGNGQWSRDTVPEQQQWVIGGENSLSAFVPGVGVGDSGYGLRLEAAHERPARRLTPSPRVFVEHGRAHLHVGSAGQSSRDVSAWDAGAALDVTGARWLTASLSYAQPFATHGLDAAAWREARVTWLFSVRVTLR